MQRISVHITDETKQRIDLAAKAQNKIEAELIREAIDAGLKVLHPQTSAKALVDLANMAKGLPSRLNERTDISRDTAEYAFGGHDE